MSSDADLNNFVIRFLLRYFRNAVHVALSRPRPELESDIDLLRMQWSISPAVRTLLKHVTEFPHEMQYILESQKREEDGLIRGRLDARASQIRRMLTAHPTITVSFAPVRSFRSRPNQVLIWVLEYAWRVARRFESLLDEQASYLDQVQETVFLLERVRRFEGIRQARGTVDFQRRPSATALTETGRSRRRIYALAANAYRLLRDIEIGDEAILLDLLNQTVLGPLKAWQMFELAVCFGVGQALAEETGHEMQLQFLAGGNKQPVARIGRFAVYWQNRTTAYETPDPEPSGVIVENLFDAYGLSVGADRPDVVIFDEITQRAVSIFEVKFFTSEESDGSDALRAAVAQIVRYARGYEYQGSIHELLDRSGIALIRTDVGYEPDARKFGVPWVVDFDGIIQQQLRRWARHLVHLSEEPAVEVFSALHH